MDYAQGVVDGRILASELTKKAALRQLSDLERNGFPYRFDRDLVNQWCGFLETLPHVKGEWARQKQTIRLEPWQCFAVGVPMGWVATEPYVKDGIELAPPGYRRFRTVYLEVPRKNAKTTLSAGVALGMMHIDDEPGAEIYSCATKADQARIVFDIGKRMAKQSTLLQGLDIRVNDIQRQEDGSIFRPLNAEASTMDGLNVSALIADELHAWKKREVYGVLDTALGSRVSPLFWNITTAGFNRAGICYDIRSYLIRIMDKVLEDETFFGCIWTADEGDDWTSEETWKKANPNYGVSVYPFYLKSQCTKAKGIPAEQSEFMTKHLNVWVNAESSWMNMHKWDLAGNPHLKLDQFEGRDCWVGLDLASKRDLACKALLFKEVDERGQPIVTAFCHHFLPHDRIAEEPAGHYDGWHRQQLLHATPGNIIDLEHIQESVLADARHYNIVEVAYDPHNATQMAGNLTEEGVLAVEVRQTPMNFDEPMRWLEALVYDGRFHHDGDPILTWAISNVVIRRTGRMHEFLHPRKERPEAKIDPVVAVLMALKRLMAEDGVRNIYDERGVITI